MPETRMLLKNAEDPALRTLGPDPEQLPSTRMFRTPARWHERTLRYVAE